MKKYFSAAHYYIFISLIAAIILLLLNYIFPSAIETAENGWLNIAYRLRGSSDLDTNIVVMYLDGEDIKALGGIPLKRSYYALLVNALYENGAGVVGFDIAFSESNIEHKDHDQLFASIVERAGNVVLSGYFHHISSHSMQNGETNIPEKFLYLDSNKSNWILAESFELPYEFLLNSTAGLGHSHLNEQNSIPLFIKTDDKLISSLAFELLNVYSKPRGGKMYFSDDNIILKSNKEIFSFPIDNDGNVNLNFAGGINSLHLTSVVEFLKSLEYSATDLSSTKSLISVKGKIVLIGIVSEGWSKFITTPYSDRFPTLGVHATFLDNAIKGNFLKYTGQVYAIISVLIFCSLTGLMVSIRRDFIGLLFVIISIIFYMGSSYFLFSNYNIVISTMLPIMGSVFSVVAGIFYKHQHIKNKIHTLSEEKDQIINELKEKQNAVENLQAELLRNIKPQSSSIQEELISKIQKYEDEINKLRTAAMDFQPASTDQSDHPGVKKIFEGIVFNSKSPMKDVVSTVEKISGSNATVLILGESGTGKELAARAIHARSSRRDKIFIPVNCGALTETLLESELFGHEKGSFTGAAKERSGRFELADGGTIFLDEIGDTTEAFQVKLLRVLQDGTFERVGGNTIRKVDVRVIAATNKDLKKNVEDKKFREDLYYRLNVLNIYMPSLRDRKTDIPLLVEEFIKQESEEVKCSQGVMNMLVSYQWRGNVRELQSIIKRAIIFATSDQRELLQLKDFPDEIIKNNSTAINFEEQILILMRAKKFSRNSISETAQELGGINRGTVAEYFRGICFKEFHHADWDIEKCASIISGVEDESQKNRVRKKIAEYLNNAVEVVRFETGTEENIHNSKAKYKNLPQKFHIYLDKVIESYRTGFWVKPK
ncbi:MAG: sigma 54-interacting transcriptional regulator [Ignavibacteriales bacterium]|nr:sigma 54-interacting transcriptional regulator [Ignavibacteriales bacterium]